MDDYGKYEENCKAIKEFNERLLKDFEAWLKASGLSEKTIDKHVSNIDFYINEYLLYEDATEAKDGVAAVDMFLGYWFIKGNVGKSIQHQRQCGQPEEILYIHV